MYFLIDICIKLCIYMYYLIEGLNYLPKTFTNYYKKRKLVWKVYMYIQMLKLLRYWSIEVNRKFKYIYTRYKGAKANIDPILTISGTRAKVQKYSPWILIPELTEWTICSVKKNQTNALGSRYLVSWFLLSIPRFRKIFGIKFNYLKGTTFR